VHGRAVREARVVRLALGHEVVGGFLGHAGELTGIEQRVVMFGVDVLSVKIGAPEVEKSLCDRHLQIRARRVIGFHASH
jgi:hypothetical protein